MIIWRGYGFLGFLLLVVGLGGGAAIADGIDKDSDKTTALCMGIGAILAGAAMWLLGRQLNVAGPAKKTAGFHQARSEELRQVAEQGRFHRGPGYAAPTSLDDARAQAQAMADEEHASIGKLLRNRHTLFFIPLQYFAYVPLLGGLFMLIGGLTMS